MTNEIIQMKCTPASIISQVAGDIEVGLALSAFGTSQGSSKMKGEGVQAYFLIKTDDTEQNAGAFP